MALRCAPNGEAKEWKRDEWIRCVTQRKSKVKRVADLNSEGKEKRGAVLPSKGTAQYCRDGTSKGREM